MANSISVVIPVYNARPFLRQAVGSVLEERDRLCDIVLVDDGSTDGSGDICDQLRRECDRIKVIHQENAGQHIARLNGACAAGGEYVMFLDSDDFFVNHPLAELNRLIETWAPDVVLFNMSYSPAGDKPIHSYTLSEGLLEAKELEHVKELLLTTDRMNHLCTKLYKRDIVIRQFGKRINDQIRIGEDLVQNLYIFGHVSRVCYTPKIFYYYRQQETSITHTHAFDYSEAEYVYRCRVEAMDAWEKTELLPIIQRNFIKRVSYNIVNSVSNGIGHTQKIASAIKESVVFDDCFRAVKKDVSAKTRAVIFLIKDTPVSFAYPILRIAGMHSGDG
ncbi:MAG: glycosyltransferase family 2 protein [Oscillospiraceae bacterium]|nr:glycosyltransferase family 2 protein [Oscillospiraceae bacterium]